MLPCGVRVNKVIPMQCNVQLRVSVTMLGCEYILFAMHRDKHLLAEMWD